jgi:hypothetical protein
MQGANNAQTLAFVNTLPLHFLADLRDHCDTTGININQMLFALEQADITVLANAVVFNNVRRVANDAPSGGAYIQVSDIAQNSVMMNHNSIEITRFAAPPPNEVGIRAGGTNNLRTRHPRVEAGRFLYFSVYETLDPDLITMIEQLCIFLCEWIRGGPWQTPYSWGYLLFV